MQSCWPQKSNSIRLAVTCQGAVAGILPHKAETKAVPRPLALSPNSIPTRRRSNFGVRWQAQRDTAFHADRRIPPYSAGSSSSTRMVPNQVPGTVLVTTMPGTPHPMSLVWVEDRSAV